MNHTDAVTINNLWKSYRMYRKPADRVWEMLAFGRRKLHTDFWALKDISFLIPRGETVGIIGRNGSGKSTLLQLICSVLQPTKGTVKVNGRISAILELGAGFHPELTGRENVIFHGIQNGLTDQEARDRVDEIAEFAEIGEFLDQPVKTYSSGMFVRLAFSAAINVDPDILIVDEALSVGDAKFQHKCFQKFHEFQNAGKTILLVTHDSETIIKHCDQALLLEKGICITKGRPKEVVNRYVELLENNKRITEPAIGLAESQNSSTSAPQSDESSESELNRFLREIPVHDNFSAHRNYNEQECRQGPSTAEICDFLVVAGDQCDPVLIRSGENIDLLMKVRFHEHVEFPHFGFAIKSVDGVMVYGLNTCYTENSISSAAADEVVVFKFSVPMKLSSGYYFIDLGVDRLNGSRLHENLDRRCSVIQLNVLEKSQFDGSVDLEATFEDVCRLGPREREAEKEAA